MGFKADAKIVAAAEKEQAAVAFTPLWRVVLELFVLLSGLVAATIVAAKADDSGIDYSPLMYISVAMTVVSAVFVVCVFKSATTDGFGTKVDAPPPERFIKLKLSAPAMPKWSGGPFAGLFKVCAGRPKKKRVGSELV